MFNTNAQCYQNISQVLLTSAFILWPTCTRGFGIREKIRCGLRFFGVFLCGFAVFGPPLRPPPFLFYQTDLVNLKQLSLSGSVNSARYMPRRFASQYIYPPLFTSPSGDSCILLTYQLALR